MSDERNTKRLTQSSNEKILKTSFERKKIGKNGLVLHVHHSMPGPRGEVCSYRFTSASFDWAGERLALSDSIGNTFIIDLLYNKFWKLPQQSSNNFLVFSRYIPKKHEILVGCISGSLHFVNVETGEKTGELIGHKESPLSVSFADDEPYCLTVCPNSAIIWDLRSNSLMHQLTLRSSISIRLVKFMPVSNSILGLFEDSSVHVWKLDNLECAKQIFPEEWGGPNIMAVALTRNGRGMVLGGQTSVLAVFLTDSWNLQKLIALPDNYKGIKYLEFVPQSFDGGANKVISVLTSNCVVLFVNTETSILLRAVDQVEGCVSRLEASLSGKYIVLVMQTGEVDIYGCSQLITTGQHQVLVSEARPKPSHLFNDKQKKLQHIDKEVTKSIGLDKLRPILKEFGEYPETYRTLIWKSILDLPENQSAFVALISKGIHPAFITLDRVFPLNDRALASSVKRLISCLAYWSPLFLQVKYLPIFVLPFVKLIRHDQFACFEVVTTIIVNWCQGWFQFVPYPPLNILDMVKSLLMVHDKQLMAHYSKYKVTADLYIWSLLETAFYEVLGWNEWQQLWDHILSNHPSFMLLVVVAFNITCRSLLLDLRNIDDFEQFFNTEVVINMKQLITKSYQLSVDTPEDVHPRKHLRGFKPLNKGNMYQMFTDYPKHILDKQLDKMSTLYEQQEDLEIQQDAINKQKFEVDAEKKQLEEVQQKEARLKELEELYKNALRREERDLENQRRSVLAARRDLREKEAAIRSQSLDKTLQDKADKYAKLEKLVDQLENKKEASELPSCGSWNSCQSTTTSSLRIQHASAVHHLSKLKKLHRQTNMIYPELKYCIDKFEDLLRRIELALERDKTSIHRPHNSEKFINLEEETQALEDEAQHLLKKLSVDVLHTSRCSYCSHATAPGSKGLCYCCGDSKKSCLF